MKLFIIDGHALIFKMYYAFYAKPMVNGKGQDVSVLFGFTKYLLELASKENPDYLAMAFDPPVKTFRHALYPEYKGTRKETPQLVRDALEPLTKICRALHIPVIMYDGFEADDTIASVAVKFASADLDVYMVTPDKDYGQVISEHVFQYKPAKGANPPEVFSKQGICEKWGICSPAQVIDLLTIMGDSSDNVPGVSGVGEVGASKLIRQYGGVDGIYANLDSLPPKQKASFEAARDHIELSRKLVTIRTDVPFTESLEQMRWAAGGFDPEITDIFQSLEFNSLMKYVKGKTSAAQTFEASGNVNIGDVPCKEQKIDYKEVTFDTLLQSARKGGCCGILASDDSTDIFSPLDAIYLSAEKEDDGYLVCKCSPSKAAPLLEDGSIDKCGYGLKTILGRLARHSSPDGAFKIKGRLYDSSLMSYLINPEESHIMENLCPAHLGISWESDSVNASNAGRQLSLFDVEEGEAPKVDEGIKFRQAALVLRLGFAIRKAMESSYPECTKLYTEMEEPLMKVLSRMEVEGVKVDLERVAEFASGLKSELADLGDEIRALAGKEDLNILSPKQIGEVLYEDLRLDPKVRRSKSGSYPTDEETLSVLREKHAIIDKILEYRAISKLISTYTDSFAQCTNPRTGKIHTTFNQTLTATGRLSSSKPNLQNIPIRDERGKPLRKAFIPSRKDGVIISADYSQIELRLMAHFCGDPHMIEAFRSGSDVHKSMAARIFGVPLEEVTPEMRRTAKTANFGIMYGISSFGLAQRLKISRAEAQKIIDDYFASFPLIKDYIDSVVTKVSECGFASTLLGRRRYLPGINASNGNIRAMARRNAVNAPIQGTAADIIKLAMVRIDKEMEQRSMKSRMVLQIHDELLFDAVKEEAPELMEIIHREMENVLSLEVPLTVECNSGDNWLDAH